MSRWTPFLLVGLLLVGEGCSPCSSATSAVSQPDGGPVRCVTAEDCPRTGNDLVCVSTSPVDFTSTCVSCVSTMCMRVTVSCP